MKDTVSASQTLSRATPTDAIAIGTKEAARLLGVSLNTMYEWAHRGLVPHRRVGSRFLFSVKRLEAWVAGDLDPADTLTEYGAASPRSQAR